MKKFLFFVGILVSVSVKGYAFPDPFSVYQEKAPTGCTDIKIADQALSLIDLIQFGICNNPKLNRDYMSVKSSEASYGASKSSYLPTVTIDARLNQDWGKTESFKSEKSHPYSGNIALSWLIYDFGGRSAQTDQMKSYLDKAQFKYNATLHDTVLALNQSYFDLLSAQEVLKSAKTSEASFKKSYEESLKKFELGLVSASDKLLAKTSYEQSRLGVIRANNNLKKTQGSLAVLLNLSPDTSLTVLAPDKKKDITRLETKMTVHDLMDLAISMRPELKSKKSELKAAEQEISIARAKAMPSLYFKAQAGTNDDWKYHQNMTYQTNVGVHLNVPLFTGFEDMYMIARAKYRYREALLSVVETQDSVRYDVWRSYQDYQTAVDSYDISQQALASATENEKVAFVSYQIGQGDILELLAASSQLAKAREQVIVAFYDVLTSKADLYRSIGRF